MKIRFDRIGADPKPFSVENGPLRLDGILEKKGHHKVILDGRISGHLELVCDRCGKNYTTKADEVLKLQLVDEISQAKDDLDIIEFLDGEIDLAYILESELNSLKEIYHFCDICIDEDEIMEIEF